MHVTAAYNFVPTLMALRDRELAERDRWRP
jgi:hypothetical protein